MIITLQRAGTFDAEHMIDNSHKCGAMATRTYTYEVFIQATDKQLSPEGYVFNNERVQEYFDYRFGKCAPKWDAVSCELLALTAAREICAVLVHEGIDVVEVRCEITGSNGARIVATYSCKQDGMPPIEIVPAQLRRHPIPAN